MARIRAVGNPVCVGIDPRVADLPPSLRDQHARRWLSASLAIEVFGSAVVDLVADLVPVVKFQAAYYEALGAAGLGALQVTAARARERGLIVLIDGKRNDIGSTAEAYAEAYLGAADQGGAGPAWPSDALTVNPYLGSDGVEPFVHAGARSGRGVFVLARTSNASAREFQDLPVAGRPLYQHVADRIAAWAEPHRGSSGYSHVGAVVGATYPAELAQLRTALPGVPFLVPGYGAQGGTASSVAAAFDADGLGAIVNSSRGITGAFLRPEAQAQFGNDWEAAIVAAVRAMIADLAAHTPAGRLKPPGPN